MRSVRPLAAAVALLAVPLLLAATEAAAQTSTTYNRTSAPAQAVGSASVVLKPSQLDFNFGNAKASLTPKGEWTVEGSVSHRGFFCAEYSLGVRFGIGRPGCANVAWLTEVTYVTGLQQCNNARLDHSGGEVQPELSGSFIRITCAERVIRCSGICK